LFNWDNPEDDLDLNWHDLNHEFNLGFTKKPRIEKVNGEKIIKISSKNKSVLIKLNDKKDTAILTTADKKTYELGVEQSDGKYKVGMRIGTYQEVAFEQLAHGINYNLLTLATSIIMRITEKDFTAFTERNIPSFKILSEDQKLMSLLERTKKLFEERYETLMRLRKNT
jgi:hypothetical protein